MIMKVDEIKFQSKWPLKLGASMMVEPSLGSIKDKVEMLNY
jgi:hypothetical protein